MSTRLASLCALLVAGVFLAGCANQPSSSQAGSPVAATVANAVAPALISNARLMALARYGSEAVYGPAPAAATETMNATQAEASYAKGNTANSAALGSFDYTLATLVNPTWPGATNGEVVWLYINHNQHVLLPGPPSAAKAMASIEAQSTDIVTVVDAATGKWLVQQEGNTFGPK